MAADIQVKLLSNENKPLEDIVVYIEAVEFKFNQKNSNTIEISQAAKAFTPYISVIQKDQPVIFHNQDEITHHIFSATKQHSFAFKIRSGASNQENLFSQSGSIAMGCNIHDWMSGYLLVLDTPHFAKTNQQGLADFKLETLAGENLRIKINIWHPQLMEEDLDKFKAMELTKNSQSITFKLKKSLADIPTQESGEDFDFLDNY